jgi:hypothetical protein
MVVGTRGDPTHHAGIRGVARGLMVRISVHLVIGERVFFGRMVRWLMVKTALLTCISVLHK